MTRDVDQGWLAILLILAIGIWALSSEGWQRVLIWVLLWSGLFVAIRLPGWIKQRG